MTTNETRSSQVFALPGGRRLDYRIYGDPAGTPVVYCHGGLSAHTDIAFASGRAAERQLQIVAVARPGIGDSTRFGPPRRVRDWADDVAVLTTALGIGSFSVLGWSAGGPYALACARVLGPRVRRTVTVGGMAPLEGPVTSGQLGLMADRVLFALSQRAPRLAAALVRSTGRLPGATAQKTLLRSLSAADRAVVGAMSTAEFSADLNEALRHGPYGIVDDYRVVGSDWGFAPEDLTGPVTLFQGSEDTLLPMAHARNVADRLPGGTLHVVEGAGHFLLHTHFEIVADALS
jgi:pimeloyl-ACP methyl ester carboxylesterase